ncbi:hypothetical protein B005_5174 [Nocardiopsis alba ATCC BAA-2165]|uniref:Uncharacterized protein n=1 Tax=Nocardiopsis alba (strain ATCC BAA-2165 / BE74) TaxID=1205910 RepID=J7L3E0_NOCAA|nr:hypothetical protein B005_5174 [Nocardiopsis alba ATCC BAA-2165]
MVGTERVEGRMSPDGDGAADVSLHEDTSVGGLVRVMAIREDRSVRGGATSMPGEFERVRSGDPDRLPPTGLTVTVRRSGRSLSPPW